MIFLMTVKANVFVYADGVICQKPLHIIVIFFCIVHFPELCKVCFDMVELSIIGVLLFLINLAEITYGPSIHFGTEQEQTVSYKGQLVIRLHFRIIPKKFKDFTYSAYSEILIFHSLFC